MRETCAPYMCLREGERSQKKKYCCILNEQCLLVSATARNSSKTKRSSDSYECRRVENATRTNAPGRPLALCYRLCTAFCVVSLLLTTGNSAHSAPARHDPRCHTRNGSSPPLEHGDLGIQKGIHEGGAMNIAWAWSLCGPMNCARPVPARGQLCFVQGGSRPAEWERPTSRSF